MPEIESLTVEWRPVSKITPYKGNPRTISGEAVDKVAASIKTYGFRQPIVVDAAGVVIAGHTRLLAAKRLKLKRVPVHVATDLTPAQVRAYRIADNKTGEFSSWDDSLLAIELGDLKTADFDLDLTGFGLDEITALPGLDGIASAGDEDGDPDKGKLLELVNITIAEPKHKVARGDHFEIGKRHHLFCASVMTDWALWAPLLKGDAIFCPYPGPFLVYGKTADDHDLVLAQPDPYTAGHILDRYAEIHGKRAIRKVAP